MSLWVSPLETLSFAVWAFCKVPVHRHGFETESDWKRDIKSFKRSRTCAALRPIKLICFALWSIGKLYNSFGFRGRRLTCVWHLDADVDASPSRLYGWFARETWFVVTLTGRRLCLRWGYCMVGCFFFPVCFFFFFYNGSTVVSTCAQYLYQKNWIDELQSACFWEEWNPFYILSAVTRLAYVL